MEKKKLNGPSPSLILVKMLIKTYVVFLYGEEQLSIKTILSRFLTQLYYHLLWILH